jgi:hypothetical protein
LEIFGTYMSKVGLHDPFGHLKLKWWPKEGPGVKLAIRFVTFKSRESTWFPCVQVVCDIPLESSRWGLQLCLSLHLNRTFVHKIMGPQSCESRNIGNFETPIWKSWDKMPFRCGPRGEAQSIL